MAHGSPRKLVPLSDASDRVGRFETHSATVTRRAFFCAVIVESDSHQHQFSKDVKEVVASLGEPVSTTSTGKGPLQASNSAPILASSSSDSFELPLGPLTRKRAMTNTSGLMDVVNELVTTERSYVKKIRILKESYADPLRKYAKSKDTAIIPRYEAQTLFGNIDALLPVNEAFLADLELMLANKGGVGEIGDVTLKHFRDLKGFESYKHYYSKREDAQRIFEQELAKNAKTGFSGYIDVRTPRKRWVALNIVQRIKYSTSDARSRVGLRELLMEPVQRIPRYTLLFRSMIKQMHPTDPQRAMLVEAEALAARIALCETDEQTRGAAVMYALGRTIDGFPADLISNSRRFLCCVDVAPSPSTPDTGADEHGTLFLFDDKLMLARRPHGGSAGRTLAGLDEVDKTAKVGAIPSAQALRKNGLVCRGVVELTDVVAADVGGPDLHLYLEGQERPLRALSLVLPPAPVNFDPATTSAVKETFLDALWDAQARVRTRTGRSVALRGTEQEVGRVERARAWFNVYERKAYLGEPKKAKVVLHIDQLGEADPIPLGIGGAGPLVVIRIQPMAGDLSRFTMSTADQSEDETDIVHTPGVPARVLQTVAQYGVFKFSVSSTLSRPGTPTGSTRSRAGRYGLDAVARGVFGGTGHHRSRSQASRASTAPTTVDSLLKFSHRSNSTGVTSPDEEGVRPREKDRESPRRKLIKAQRGRSPASGSENESPRRAPIVASTAREHERDKQRESMDASERDLAQRLELARRNSQNQGAPPPAREPALEDTIYEEEAPRALPARRRDLPVPPPTAPQRPVTPQQRPCTPQRPAGPRSPGTPRSLISVSADDHSEFDVERQLERTLTQLSGTGRAPRVEAAKLERELSRKRHAEDEAPAAPATPARTPSVIEPLSIRKKTSVSVRESPAGRRAGGPATRGSPRVRPPPPTAAGKASMDRVLVVAETTREDVNSSRRAVKRIKLELDALQAGSAGAKAAGALPRSPQIRQFADQASARVAEMRAMIEQRNRGGIPTPPPTSSDPPQLAEEWAGAVEELVSDAEKKLKKAASGQETLQDELVAFAMMFKEKVAEADKLVAELQRTKMQCDLVKKLLADATAEKDIMYDAFNEELDGMFNDAHLPETEAWQALTRDLRTTKQARNTLASANAKLQQELATTALQRDQWGELVRAHGLVL